MERINATGPHRKSGQWGTQPSFRGSKMVDSGRAGWQFSIGLLERSRMMAESGHLDFHERIEG
jgi:hypothetical protein